jgi:GT2 family glycosyltransferase
VQSPSVSVIIVNWNHDQYLKLCLDSLLAQKYEKFDINIVDNGSRDGSPQRIANDYPDINCWIFPNNRGFSWAFNWGVNHTNSEFVLSLNPDVFVRQDFLQEMVNAMCQDDSVGIVSAKLLRVDDPTILDSTGLFINRYRRPYDRGQGEFDLGQYDTSSKIFGACGAAALYRRSMLVDIALEDEYFDEDFFSYYEDADLAWRAQLRGWNGRYAPRAVATHVRGWGDTLRKRKDPNKDNYGPRLALRNRYLMTVKNDTLKYFLFDFPMILITELPRLFYMAIYAPENLMGMKDFVFGIKSALNKRKLIRKRRIIDDATLRSWFEPQMIKQQYSG